MKDSPHFNVHQSKGSAPAQAVNITESSRFKDDASAVVIFFTKTLGAALYDLKCALIKIYARVTQFCSWFVIWPLMQIFFKISYHDRQNLKNLKTPLIITANHQRFYDAFLLRIVVGLFSNLLPMRFMATINFTDPFLRLVKKTGFIHFLYATTGVFTVERGLGLNKNLKRAKAILKNKGVVAMFPEGTMTKSGQLQQFKRGVSALALSSNTKVLPIAIKISKNTGFTFFGLRRTKIDVKIGEARRMSTHRTYEELADELKVEVQGMVDSMK